MRERFSIVMLLMASGFWLTEGNRRSVLADMTTSLSWRQVMSFFWDSIEDPGPGRIGGPRPAGDCAISPWDREVWSLQPILLWKGSMQSAGIREEGSFINPPHLPVQIVNGVRLAQVTEPLQPGETYNWTLYFSESSSQFSAWTSFQIMDEEQRAVITAGLHALEIELAEANATVEEVVMSKVQYFSEEGLPFDALQVMFSVEEPSSELVESRQEAVERICNLSEENDMEIDNGG